MAKQHDKQFKLDVLKKQSTFWGNERIFYMMEKKNMRAV